MSLPPDAGSMEVQGALAEWRRSGTTTFIGDGDCKAHKANQEAKPYGPFPVVCRAHSEESWDTPSWPEQKARDKGAEGWEVNWWAR